MLKTRFTTLVGCRVPIEQAGMGTLTNPRLAAAITEAGGMGMLSVSGGTPEEIIHMLGDVRALTNGPFGANFLTPFLKPESKRECAAAAASIADVVDFFYGEPDSELVEEVRKAGKLAAWQVGSAEEAVAAERAGCDLIIAQGIEAGGHVRGTIGLMALLNEVLDRVRVPVLAAGGIGSARSLAAVLAAGADGARVGTRFIAAEESEAHPDYVRALIAAEAKDTIYTDVFSGGWPGAPHRVLRSSLEAVQAFKGEVVGEQLDEDTGERYPVKRFSIGTIRKTTTGNLAAMPHWAGESVGGIKSVQPAREIVRELAEGAEKLLRRWG